MRCNQPKLRIHPGSESRLILIPAGVLLCTLLFASSIQAATQTITFPPHPESLKVGNVTELLASASSQLTVTYTSQTPTICSVVDVQLTALTEGTCTIAANQAGNVNYDPALEVTHSFLVLPAQFQDNGDGTVTDLYTTLTWMRCSIGQSWDSINSTCTGSPVTYTWGSANGFSTSYAGYNDWRLPTLHELQSIIDYAHPPSQSASDDSSFPNTAKADFWSSTEYHFYPDDAWMVSFFTGHSKSDQKTANHYIRLVRGDPFFGSVTSDSNGTATDPATGLTWKRCAEGQTWNVDTVSCGGSALTYTQAAARQLTSVFAGYGDWRLPSIGELLTLAEYTASNPALDSQAFPGTVTSRFWSANVYVKESNKGWQMATFDAASATGTTDDTQPVLMVRGRQAPGYYQLDVSLNGTGSVNGSGGLDCGVICTHSYPPGTVITLTATPDQTGAFFNWSGDCASAGSSPICTLTIDADKQVTAFFLDPVPTCSATPVNNPVLIDNRVYQNETITCASTMKVSAASNVIVDSTGNVAYSAPEVHLLPGFSVVEGGKFHAGNGVTPLPRPTAARFVQTVTPAGERYVLKPLGVTKTPVISDVNSSSRLVDLLSYRGISIAELQQLVWSVTGSYGVLVTDAPLIDQDTNGLSDVYYYNQELNLLTLISHTADGAAGNGASDYVSLSGNGDLILFQSTATDLLDESVADHSGIYLYDTVNGAMKRIETDGIDPAHPVMDRAGEWIVLDALSESGGRQIEMDNRVTGERLIFSPDQGEGIHHPTFSPDASQLGFQSEDAWGLCQAHQIDLQTWDEVVSTCPN